MPDQLANVRKRIEQADLVAKNRQELLVEYKQTSDEYSKAGLIWLACFIGLTALSIFISPLLGVLLGTVGLLVMLLNVSAVLDLLSGRFDIRKSSSDFLDSLGDASNPLKRILLFLIFIPSFDIFHFLKHRKELAKPLPEGINDDRVMALRSLFENIEIMDENIKKVNRFIAAVEVGILTEQELASIVQLTEVDRQKIVRQMTYLVGLMEEGALGTSMSPSGKSIPEIVDRMDAERDKIAAHEKEIRELVARMNARLEVSKITS